MNKYSFKSHGVIKGNTAESYMRQVIKWAVDAFNKFGEVGTDMQGYLYDTLRRNEHGIKEYFCLTDSFFNPGSTNEFPLKLYRKKDLKRDPFFRSDAKPVFTINKRTTT